MTARAVVLAAVLLSALLLVVLVSGCASMSVSRDGAAATGTTATAEHSASAGRVADQAAAPSLPTMELPVCGFEAPYLPDPCRLEVAHGEWLRISNPKPKETKKHGWLWWLLVAGLL